MAADVTSDPDHDEGVGMTGEEHEPRSTRAAGESARRRRRWGAAVAAAAVLLLATGFVVWWASDDTDRIDAAGDGPVATTSTTQTTSPCGGPTVFVYVEPGVDLERAQAMSSELEAISPGDPYEFMDQERTFEEFQRLFADQPDFLAAISPEELPQSYRLTPSEPWTGQQISAAEALPGVLRVEAAADYAGPVCGVPSTTSLSGS